MTEVTVTVNGHLYERAIDPRLSLGDFLRHELGLTGTHLGCEHGVCGTCTVLVDGVSARACLMFAVQADGCNVRTIESLARPDGRLHPLQSAFQRRHALQCGFCTPGFLMTLVEFLAENRAPSDEQIRDAISGNLCRCTGYQPIIEAVREAAIEIGREGA